MTQQQQPVSQIAGYMIEVQWDGRTLRAHGRNKMARIALNGQDHAEDVVLTRAQMAEVAYKPAKLATNGALTITTREGKRHMIHFRRKQADDFRRLYDQLRAG